MCHLLRATHFSSARELIPMAPETLDRWRVERRCLFTLLLVTLYHGVSRLIQNHRQKERASALVLQDQGDRGYVTKERTLAIPEHATSERNTLKTPLVCLPYTMFSPFRAIFMNKKWCARLHSPITGYNEACSTRTVPHMNSGEKPERFSPQNTSMVTETSSGCSMGSKDSIWWCATLDQLSRQSLHWRVRVQDDYQLITKKRRLQGYQDCIVHFS